MSDLDVTTLLDLNPEKFDLSNCDREPIHTPGSIQPHGVLIVARLDDHRIVYCSENAPSVTGIPIAAMLGKSLDSCLDWAILDAILSSPPSLTAPYKTVSFDLARHNQNQAGHGSSQRRHLHVHTYADHIYVEVEPAIPSGIYDDLLSQTQVAINAIRGTRTLGQLLRATATQIRALNGYDRTMVYRFDEDGHGHVVAEDCEPEMESFLDLHYPASDIPAQARRLYLLQRVRVIPDVNYQPVPILAEPGLETAPPLDMTYCSLRSVSPMHTEYLANMGVGATLTLSLICDDKLWGLIVCHHREARIPSVAVRSSSDLISQLVSFLIRECIEADLKTETLRCKSMLDSIYDSIESRDGVLDGLLAAQGQVLSLVDATGAVLCFDGVVRTIGVAPPAREAARLFNQLRAHTPAGIVSSSCLSELFPGMDHLRPFASGVLLMSIVEHPGDGILWFRPEEAATVKWGGNPDKAADIDAITGRIAPRRSFAVWKTLVEGRSLPWLPVNLESVRDLRRRIASFFLTRAEAEFSRVRRFDSLTGIANRRLLQEHLVAWTERGHDRPASAIFVDLDRFKVVNDAFGHNVGDDLLQQVATRLGAVIPEDVLLARLGGDEFVIFSEGLEVNEVQQIAELVTTAFSLPFQVGGRPFRITASLGIAHASDGSPEELLRAADTAMNAAKRDGRNKTVSFNPGLHKTVLQNLELEQDLYQALERGEFKLVYQPLVHAPQGTLLGFEALLRWHHPTRGLVSPDDFIPLAEETGLIVPIGLWVMREAASRARAWADEFAHSLIIHVNVAALQLTTPGFVAQVETILEEAGISADCLSIEVTESTMMREAAVETLRELRALGLKVSLDDFGMGYSSLSYLRRLPIDLVKIDRSFVVHIDDDAESLAFFDAIVKLTQTLGLAVIAEGVETIDQCNAVYASGCGGAQGYLFSRPMDSEAVEAFLTTNRIEGWSTLLH